MSGTRWYREVGRARQANAKLDDKVEGSDVVVIGQGAARIPEEAVVKPLPVMPPAHGDVTNAVIFITAVH